MGDLVETLRRALADAGVADADVYVRRVRRGFARFSLNTLNQHAQTEEDLATVRAAIPAPDGYRLAAVSTTEVSHAALVDAIGRANAMARSAEIVPGWPGFAPGEGATPKIARHADATANCTAMRRAELLRPCIERARDARLTAAGALETTAYDVAVANTAGLAREASGTVASFRMFALDADGTSGFAQCTHRDIERLDVRASAERACEKSLAGKDPVALPAGNYDVVLEPSAVTELLEWLAFIAFGAREVADGTSPLAGRRGERITGANVTIRDDALDESDLGFGVPFDRDGVVRSAVTLVDRGVACEPVYDRLYGARLGHASTGHAGPPGGMEDAPVAQAVRMAGGDAQRDDLIRSVKRGLLITRFHYVNGFLDPRRALMTGLTRDGTFLIEDGRITRGVRNMRFTDSVLEAFDRIDGLSRALEAVPTWWSEAGAFVAPTMLVRGFRFTGGGVEKTAI